MATCLRINSVHRHITIFIKLYDIQCVYKPVEFRGIERSRRRLNVDLHGVLHDRNRTFDSNLALMWIIYLRKGMRVFIFTSLSEMRHHTMNIS
jgi:hypothetical protein